MQEMLALISKGKCDGPHFEQIMVRLWKMILGEDCFDEGKPGIQCMAHAIPKWQSRKILEYMLVQAGLGSPSVGLNYVNIAPSTFGE